MPTLAVNRREPCVDPIPLAPRWHTAALIGVIATVAIAGTLLPNPQTPPTGATAAATSRIMSVYLPMFLVQVGLLAYVCRVGRPRSALSSLLGARWQTWHRALIDVGIAVVTCWLIGVAEHLYLHSFGAPSNLAITRMLPSTDAERAAWMVVAITVGFSEEVVFRGYLQNQLTACTKGVVPAIVLQSLLFGLAHGEQGTATALRTAVYGAVLGALAAWRRSLVPGILCHVGIDLASGLLHR